MTRTLDGQGVELDKFHTPAVRFGHVNAPVNTLGIRRVVFAVDGRPTTAVPMARGTGASPMAGNSW